MPLALLDWIMLAETVALAPKTLTAPLPASTLAASDATINPINAARPSFLSHLLDRPARAVMARLRLAAWQVLDLETEFTVLD